jgi:peroxin-6
MLLHGLEGCGKQIIVRQVAKSLGLHIIEYNCYDLLGASKKKTKDCLIRKDLLHDYG